MIIPDLWHALWFDDYHDEVADMVKSWIIDRFQTRPTADQLIDRSHLLTQDFGRHLRQPHGPGPTMKK